MGYGQNLHKNRIGAHVADLASAAGDALRSVSASLTDEQYAAARDAIHAAYLVARDEIQREVEAHYLRRINAGL